MRAASQERANTAQFLEKDNRNSKSAKKLFKIYLNSVGNNCTLLLNIPPNAQGEIHKKDVKNLEKLGKMINNITKNPIVYQELGELTKDKFKRVYKGTVIGAKKNC